MAEFIFDEEAHTYTLDGRILPSVNHIMESVGCQDYGFIESHKKEWYFARGSYVHLAMTLYFNDELDFDGLDERIKGYVQAGINWVESMNFEPKLVEKPLYHPVYHYAGTPDAYGILDGREVLVDFKTGVVNDWVKWQTAAYVEMIKANTLGAPVERYGIQLMENGQYKMTEPWLSQTDILEFHAFLTTYKRQVVRVSEGKIVRVS